jgi:hypothetical protein
VIESQKSKIVAVTVPVAIVDNASWTTIEVDTKGFEYATYYVMLGASDIAMTALAVTESDTAGSGHANVTGLIFGTSTNTAGSTSTLPSATDDGLIFGFEIDLRPRKRYLDLTATAGNGAAGTFAVAWCELSRAHTTPDTATERGASQILRV